MISGSRTLACVLRKSSLCQCGCRGYCTLFPVLNVLRWSIGVMETGYFPSARHDGSSWHSTDRSQSRRGVLAAKAAVIYIKGDWMEYVTTMSFPSWTHNLHPCPMCFCSPDTTHDLKNCTLESVGWDLKTIDHYMEECERREIHVVVDGSGHVKIRNSLRITHRRERGGRARQLMVDIPEYGLRAHDRLEPTPWMSEYAMFDATARFPAPFVFWRADEQAWTQHRNPLFDRRLGGVPQRVIVGALHCLFLGVVQRYCGARDPSTLGARRVASRGCSVRGACRGVGLAFARPVFWLVLRPRTRWPPFVQGGEPHGQHVRELLMPHEGRGNEQLSWFRGGVGRPLETCHIRRGHVVERWCGTGQRDRPMPPISVGPPSRNAG